VKQGQRDPQAFTDRGLGDQDGDRQQAVALAFLRRLNGIGRILPGCAGRHGGRIRVGRVAGPRLA
jgi:hypothetical protein